MTIEDIVYTISRKEDSVLYKNHKFLFRILIWTEYQIRQQTFNENEENRERDTIPPLSIRENKPDAPRHRIYALVIGSFSMERVDRGKLPVRYRQEEGGERRARLNGARLAWK